MSEPIHEYAADVLIVPSLLNVRTKEGSFEYVKEVVWCGAAMGMQNHGFLAPVAFIFSTMHPLDGSALSIPVSVMVGGDGIPPAVFMTLVKEISTRSKALGVVIAAQMCLQEVTKEGLEEAEKKFRSGQPIEIDESKSEKAIYVSLEHISGNRCWIAKVHTKNGMRGVGDWEELPQASFASGSGFFSTGLVYGGWQ